VNPPAVHTQATVIEVSRPRQCGPALASTAGLG